MRNLALLPAAFLALAALAPEAHAKRVIVLGFDGMDPDILGELIDEGRLPNMAKMAKTGGGLHDLATSIPPQSPVAWSDFITGMDSGGHGIFDFLHRDRATIIPYLSTSRPVPAEGEPWVLGGYNVPNPFAGGGGGFELLRRGKPFWQTLEENGVPCMVIRMPSNFPVSGEATYELSGMGTPDIRGTYGSFSYYTTDHTEFPDEDVSGGEAYNISLRNQRAVCKIEGPVNPLIAENKKRIRAFAEFTVDVDPDEDYAMITMEGTEHLLKVGEWTEWIPIALPFTPDDAGAVSGALLGAIAPPAPDIMAPSWVKRFRKPMRPKPKHWPPGCRSLDRVQSSWIPKPRRWVSHGIRKVAEKSGGRLKWEAAADLNSYPETKKTPIKQGVFFLFGSDYAACIDCAAVRIA